MEIVSKKVIVPAPMKKAGVEKIRSTQDNGVLNCVVRVADVRFAEYQREVIESHVERINNEYWALAVQPLKVSFRDGELWCYDGRQTSAVLAKRGITSAEAAVVTGLSYTQEASLFHTHNTVPKKVGGWQCFRAALDAEKTSHKQVAAAWVKAGLVPPGTDDPADVTKPGAFLWVNRLGGPKLLGTVCRVLAEACKPDGKPLDPLARRTDFLRGLGLFLNSVQGAGTAADRLISAIKADWPLAKICKAANRKAKTGRPDSTHFRQMFEDIVK